MVKTKRQPQPPKRTQAGQFIDRAAAVTQRQVVAQADRVTRLTGRLADTEIGRQAKAARAHSATERKAGRVAVAAGFDAMTDRIVVEMSTGWLFGIPVHAIYPELKGATREQLEAVTIDELGLGLHWEALDVDVSILGIVAEFLGERNLLSAAGRAGGQVRSKTKAAAARANGAKGGRPRKVTT